ncbi:MAG: AAA family ATPase [Mediterranea sp.]|jgi:predicted ATP-binding protein involved in virulence|nr:AAA family ATPase [Mediterranea sp.]
MKLKHIHIDSYKVFQDFDIDFCKTTSPFLPQDIIVLAGVNGMGKTTLLKEIIASQELVDGRTMTFYDDAIKDDFIAHHTPLQASLKYKFDGILFLPAAEMSLTQLESYVLTYLDKLVFEDDRTSAEAYRNIQSIMDDIFGKLDLHIHFTGIDRNRKLLFSNDSGDTFGMEALSSGEKQIMGKIFPLFTGDIRDKIVLMDEPEESLHPSWQIQLLPIIRRCAEKTNCQFILATHSPHIIASAKQEELRLLVRDDEGKIKAVECSEGPYGWTVEKVLNEIQQVPYNRVPEMERELSELRGMINNGEYDTPKFKEMFQIVETTLGSDPYLSLLRMEIARRRKQHEADK